MRIKRGPSAADEPLPRALAPGSPYFTGEQQAALRRLAASVVAGDGRFAAAARHPAPRRRRASAGIERGAPLQHGHVEAAELSDLVARLDQSALVVQGPPGSGKTWAGAQIAVHLMRQGRRVGVMAPSHKAIHNLLDEIERLRAIEGFEFRGLKKSTASNPESVYDGDCITSSTSSTDALPAAPTTCCWSPARRGCSRARAWRRRSTSC